MNGKWVSISTWFFFLWCGLTNCLYAVDDHGLARNGNSIYDVLLGEEAMQKAQDFWDS